MADNHRTVADFCLFSTIKALRDKRSIDISTYKNLENWLQVMEKFKEQ